MNKDQLDYFAWAYRMNSFSAAAARAHISAQGLAKAIHSLENELNVKLFTVDSSGKRIPTAYAEELMGFTLSFNHHHRELLNRFKYLRAQERHTVRLGASLGILGLLGPDFLEDFKRDNPEITVTYNELPDDLCEEALLDGSYDLALTLAPYNKDFATHDLQCMETFFWVPADDPLSERESLVRLDLEGKVIAIPGKDFKCYRTIIRTAEDEGIVPERVVFSSEIFWIYEFVAQKNGIGFSIGPLVELPLFKSYRDVRAVLFKDAVWRFGISHIPAHRLTDAEQTFYDYCVRRARRGKPQALAKPFQTDSPV
ncbi:MAG: LysR family transcriptional regulator [Coriobacteriales bacterium]|nr:LysR family transcriptional regulator [Coriobacteriales bacterium]